MFMLLKKYSLAKSLSSYISPKPRHQYVADQVFSHHAAFIWNAVSDVPSEADVLKNVVNFFFFSFLFNTWA